ncbi:MAG: hypothetical protein JNJ88_04050 [Planctomycetes bacterium]|nr:hypothetical protein [Planctomycetota bacterium]
MIHPFRGAGVLRRGVPLSAAWILAVLVSCATPTGIREASAHHGQNLSALRASVEDYRELVRTRLEEIFAACREAYVSEKFRTDVEAARDLVAAADASTMQKKAASIARGIQKAAKEFDRHVANLAPKSIEDLKIEDPSVPTLAPSPKADEALKTWLVSAVNARRALTNLDVRLEVLSRQIAVYQAFHDKVDEYLQIDATIDGDSIARAAAAGSNLNFAKIQEAVLAIRRGELR